MGRLHFPLLLSLVSVTFGSSSLLTLDRDWSARRDDDVSLAALRTLVQQQAATVNQLQAGLSAYRNQVDSYKNQLDTYKHQLDAMQQKMEDVSKSVAFTARISYASDSVDNGTSLGHHQTVIFDEAVTNIGNAYNPKTGLFTAPVAGTFVFFLQQMCPSALPSLSLALVKDGARLQVVYSKGVGDRFDQGSSQVTTHLLAGERVWVRQSEGSGVRGHYWTVFTGFLLRAE